MKKTLLSTLAVLGLRSGLVGCKKDSENPVEPITATFQVLNEQGQETAVFAAGQNVVFRYEVRNTTDRDIDIKAPVYDGAAFLEVFDEASGQSVGTPYEGLCTSCRRYFVVLARGTLTFTVPWVTAAQYPAQEPFCTHAATTWLPKGRYHTAVVPRLSWSYGTDSTTMSTHDGQALVRSFGVR